MRMEEDPNSKNVRGQSLLQNIPDNAPCYIKGLKKIDFFAFIPVPKDEAVSTKQSLIGSTLFFLILLAYIAYDFTMFLVDNPPIQQSFYTPIDEGDYQVPDFAITFMEGQYLDKTQLYQNYYQFQYTQEIKNRGTKIPVDIGLYYNTQEIDWLDKDTRIFYSILRSPKKVATAKGLLYSTNNATYSRIKISKCNLNIKNNTCATDQQIAKKSAGGRVFLFVRSNGDKKDVKYQLYNFFLVPNLYKRVTIQLQLTRTDTLPDYFWRWRTQNTSRIIIHSVLEQTSDTSINDKIKNQTSLQLMSISFLMSPQILNTRVTCQTLLDHVSMWGAFWSVIFGVFAIIFLSFNRNKYYRHNPDWDKFKNYKYAINASEERH